MLTIRITSWNTQGDATSSVGAVHSIVLPPQYENLLLLQESGSMASANLPENEVTTVGIGLTNYTALFSPQKKVKNKRCTTGVLFSGVPKYMRKYHTHITKRPLVVTMLNFDSFMLAVATIHTTAKHTISRRQVKELTEWLYEYTEKKAKKTFWILMGDFNLTPDALIRKYPEYDGLVVSSDQTTHVGEKYLELDYAIVSEGLENVFTMKRHDGFDSDHIPVYIELTEDMVEQINRQVRAKYGYEAEDEDEEDEDEEDEDFEEATDEEDDDEEDDEEEDDEEDDDEEDDDEDDDYNDEDYEEEEDN